MRFRFDNYEFEHRRNRFMQNIGKRRSNIFPVFCTIILLTLFIFLLFFKKAEIHLSPENAISIPASFEDISPPVLQRKSSARAIVKLNGKVAEIEKNTENSFVLKNSVLQKIEFPLRNTFRRLSGDKQKQLLKPILEPTPFTESAFNHKIKKQRLILVQAATLAGGLAAFRKMQNLFGGIAQPFRMGNDWSSDNAIHFDELLHFQGSYRLARGIADLYKWSGVEENRADFLGVGLTVSAMTFLEYLDGRRSNDYASFSDLAANLLGVTFAYMKPRVPFFQKIDFRVSYERITDPLKSHSLANYDRITQWITYDLSSHMQLPLELAIGYRVKHAYSPAAKPELHIGLGFSLGKLLMPHNSHSTHPLRILDAYQVGFSRKVQ